MAFGISFGSKKNKFSQDTTINKTEVGTEATKSLTDSTKTSNTNSTSNQAGTQTTNQSGTSTGQSASNGLSNTAQSQVSQNFSDKTLDELSSAVSQMFGNSNGGQAQQISDFNADEFVGGIMQGANARAQTGLDESTAGIIDAVGGRNNSMSALLQARLFNDASASLANTESQARAQAEEISRNNIVTGTQVEQNENQFLLGLLNNLRGGQTTQTGNTQTAEQQSGTQAQQTTQAGTESNNTTQTSSAQTVDVLKQLLDQLVNSNATTAGTESTKGKSKGSGFGAGLSI